MPSILDRLSPEEREIALKRFFPSVQPAQDAPQAPFPVPEPMPEPVAPTPAPVPQKQGFDWGSLADAIGVGVSGIGDAYSAAAGRNTSFGKNALDMVQSKEKLQREQSEKELKRKRAQETLFKLTGKHFENADEIMANSEILKSIMPEKPKKEKNKVAIFDPIKKTFTDTRGNILQDVDPSVYDIRESKEPAKGKEGDGLTVAQKKVDQNFANTYNKWVLEGDFSDVMTQLNGLDSVLEDLKSGKKNLTGAGLSLQPDFTRKRLFPASMEAQQTVEQSVQRTLKKTLGGQFTEREGVMFLQRGYDPSLDEKANSKKLERAVGQLKMMVKAKQDAVEYYEENGTLKGYKGKLYSLKGGNMVEVKNEDMEKFLTSTGLDSGSEDQAGGSSGDKRTTATGKTYTVRRKP